jgi:hypothetical protein
MKLGGITLINPSKEKDGHVAKIKTVASVHELADGSVGSDWIATRYLFTIKWQNVSYVERNAIRTQANLGTVQDYEPPDLVSGDPAHGHYHVIITPDSYSEQYDEASAGTNPEDKRRYTITLGLTEVD